MYIQEKIIGILSSVILDDSVVITSESVIASDLGISSFDFMQVIYQIETEFSVEISDEELENFVTVQDLIDYLSR